MTTGAMVIEQSYDTFSRPQTLTTTYDAYLRLKTYRYGVARVVCEPPTLAGR